jgi:hypothetical protein
MIEAWGINTFEDLFMKFMIDNKKLDGPMLARRRVESRTYRPGWLSIFRDADRRVGADMTAYPYMTDRFRNDGGAQPSNTNLQYLQNFGNTAENAFRSQVPRPLQPPDVAIAEAAANGYEYGDRPPRGMPQDNMYGR